MEFRWRGCIRISYVATRVAVCLQRSKNIMWNSISRNLRNHLLEAVATFLRSQVCCKSVDVMISIPVQSGVLGIQLLLFFRLS